MASIEELQEELVRQSTKRLETEHERAVLEEQWRAVSKELNAIRTENTALKKENSELVGKTEQMELDLAELSSNLLDEANQKVSDANRRAASTLKLVSERDVLIESQEAQLHALKEMLDHASTESIPNSEVNRSVKGMFGTRGGSRTSSLPSSPAIGNGSPAVFVLEKQGRSPEKSHSSSSTSLKQHQQPALSLSENSPEPSTNSTKAGSAGLTHIDQISRDLILDLDSYSSPLRPFMRTDIRDFDDFVELWGVERTAHPNRFGKLEWPPWRRSRFVQRVLAEDVENTLRLDKTPHMSWLACRAFLNGILDKTIALEPVSSKEMPWRLRPSHPCLLCGENRSAERYSRSFWAIPNHGAEPIVLDLACVTKAQLACEMVNFLRHIASLEPANSKTHAKAWQQCITLREQLFWARSGALFPELSEEVLETLRESKYNEYDFDTLDERQAYVEKQERSENEVTPEAPERFGTPSFDS